MKNPALSSEGFHKEHSQQRTESKRGNNGQQVEDCLTDDAGQQWFRVAYRNTETTKTSRNMVPPVPHDRRALLFSRRAWFAQQLNCEATRLPPACAVGVPAFPRDRDQFL